MTSYRSITFLSLALLGLTVLPAWSAAPQSDALLERFLVKELGLTAQDEMPTRYRFKQIDLNGDKKPEIVVMVEGGMVCGTGGCQGYVLQKLATGYKKNSAFTLLRTPVFMSAHKTKGWNDLVVSVSGGGVQAGLRVLAYNGQSYPSNPSLPPAQLLRTKMALTPIFAADAPSLPLTPTPDNSK